MRSAPGPAAGRHPNFIQNGFVEESSFSGALQTRLVLAVGTGWALVLQALLLGVWHLRLGFTNTGHAGTIVPQSVLGLAFPVPGRPRGLAYSEASVFAM
ncbi:membrane protease YdiL (CAAX protease family) [Arthrobacter ginsengisoli]|uniref:Membrane protease YdiL (CAAX protease family) n=1 Tax=Arthrobacter ginsengisoli TaxID=1356565 RepID=A0ABU1UAA3_9MICC|nr:CPBP family intramembrane glutamic endopeptidase [Arthrobacter ginsengisoli]MDR7082097.1 membrane protease YdiL (CAAX protease family) [Arthrobacter ginsengisoli]